MRDNINWKKIFTIISILAMLITGTLAIGGLFSRVSALEGNYDMVSTDHKPWSKMVENNLAENSVQHAQLFIILEVIQNDLKEIKTTVIKIDDTLDKHLINK